MTIKSTIIALAVAGLLGATGAARAQSTDSIAGASSGNSASGGEGPLFGYLPLTGSAYSDGSR